MYTFINTMIRDYKHTLQVRSEILDVYLIKLVRGRIECCELLKVIHFRIIISPVLSEGMSD